MQYKDDQYAQSLHVEEFDDSLLHCLPWNSLCDFDLRADVGCEITGSDITSTMATIFENSIVSQLVYDTHLKNGVSWLNTLQWTRFSF